MSKRYLRGLMLLGAALAAAAQAAAGSRPTGDAGVSPGSPFGGNLAMEHDCCVALTADAGAGSASSWRRR